MKKYFNVNVSRYSTEYHFDLWCASSLDNPKDNAVTFLTESHIDQWTVFCRCSSCLIFWPEQHEVPQELRSREHVIIKCKDPHLRYCQFFAENGIIYLPENSVVESVNGAFISPRAVIGRNTIVFPGAYVGDEVCIGQDCFIGSGVKLVGEVHIGDKVVIRENSVVGADGLSTDRDENGNPVHMPQFGGVRIGNAVVIGANTVIARGAIDDTIIEDYASIDNCSFISHNVHVGKRSFIVGETILFGSSVVGDDSFISGNSTVRNGIRIGSNTLVGMGSVVVKDVEAGAVIKGNPAR